MSIVALLASIAYGVFSVWQFMDCQNLLWGSFCLIVAGLSLAAWLGVRARSLLLATLGAALYGAGHFSSGGVSLWHCLQLGKALFDPNNIELSSDSLMWLQLMLAALLMLLLLQYRPGPRRLFEHH